MSVRTVHSITPRGYQRATSMRAGSKTNGLQSASCTAGSPLVSQNINTVSGLSQHHKNVHKNIEDASGNGCVFCKQFSETQDEKYYILKRNNNTVVILNLYPYNAGHLMVIPLEHESELENLALEVQSEMISTASQSIELLKKTMEPHGFNVGFNLGKTGGAGIPSHLHMHIVPRWNGDTNFLPVIGDTKAVSLDLNEVYQLLKKAFDKL